ncbi:MAG TPA: hypothetical protein VGH92_06120 [Gaiellaceae bacterium]|jgi:hypothetical protein
MSRHRPDDESLEAIRERGRQARQEMKEAIERARARERELQELLRRGSR